MKKFTVIVALLIIISIFAGCQKRNNYGYWDIPKNPVKTNIEPAVGDYKFKAERLIDKPLHVDFKVISQSGPTARGIIITIDGKPTQAIPVEEGAFMAYRSTDPTIVHSDDWAISGSFISAKKATGKMQFFHEGLIFSAKDFTATLK